MITENSATPSTKAAATIMFERRSLAISGWRAMASRADPPMSPMPIPAPTAAIPAPMPASPAFIAVSMRIVASSIVYGLGLVVYLMMRLLCSVAEIQRRKKRKDVGLEERHKEFNQVHKDHEQCREHAGSHTHWNIISRVAQ